MKLKTLNLFEQNGMLTILDTHADIECYDLTTGTSKNGMLNFQNTIIDQPPSWNYPCIGGAGLTEASDVIIQMWDEEGNADQHYIGQYPAFDWEPLSYDMETQNFERIKN